MNEFYQEYLDSISNLNTRKNAKGYSAIGDFDFANCDLEELKQLLLGLNPSCLKEIDTIKGSIKAWLRYRYPDSDIVYQRIVEMFGSKELNREDMWEMAKSSTSRKFISHKQYIEILNNIEKYEDHNPDYLQTLLMSFYEGLFSRDYAVTWNLRGSDIKGNIVTIRYSDGSSHNIQVTKKLVDNLRLMSKVDVTQRRNRNNTFYIKISGLYTDSCFKIERRELKGVGINYANSYGNMIRKIVKEYVEYPLSVQQIYVSGIMYRLGIALKQQNITLEEAFRYNNKSRIVSTIIHTEFERINASFNIKNFRENVRGFLDVFNEDWIDT